jgi:hypothetical protein
MVEQHVDRIVRAMHGFTTPAEHARLVDQLEDPHGRERVLLGWLEDELFPQATANGRNQSGIIAGKLNGVGAATTPTGCRTISTSTPPATCPGSRPSAATARRKRPPPTRCRARLADRVGQRLAHVGGDDPPQLLAVAVSESRSANNARARA